MPGDRSRYGLFVSALGAVVLAVSVFLPWYGLSIVLLALAALAMLDALLALARHGAPVPGGAGSSVVLLGAVAAVCAIYRMIELPAAAGLLALSSREGAWLALLGALTMVLGGMWPRRVHSAAAPGAPAPDAPAPDAWPGIAGRAVGN